MKKKGSKHTRVYEYFIGRIFWRLSETAFGSRIVQRMDDSMGSSIESKSPVTFRVNIRAMTGLEDE